MAATSRQDIFEKVRETLVEALGVEDDEVTEDATLQGDLGAESIDFLDIVFRLEKLFGIKIAQEELIPRDILSNPDYVNDRKLNDAGLAALREHMPHADLSEFEEDPDIDKIGEVFTVGTVINFLEHKLAAQ